MNLREFLIGGVLLILFFALLLVFIFRITISYYLEKGCEMLCKDLRKASYYRYSEPLSCSCGYLTETGIEWRSVFEK